MVQQQASQKNHPNVQASGVQPLNQGEKSSRKAVREEHTRRVLKTSSGDEENRCKFHDRTGHTLSECKAFDAKTMEEKTEWILKERLCFRCCETGHVAKECKVEVTCTKCGSDRHPAFLHKEKNEEELKSNCTSVCQRGGTSCSKILLVDVFHQERPHDRHRVYAIIDDQSNASMIAPELVNKLKISGPSEKYLLSTCSGEKMVNYGRRVAGIMIDANGKSSKLPTLVECSHIPRDKGEIPNPEIAN
ncbi:hypothetical protein QZH41_008056 [Actinostola sp. cb2023]|nr:hypothetical protein QZH41_008056 [Actinostola sp. cb2023]